MRRKEPRHRNGVARRPKTVVVPIESVNNKASSLIEWLHKNGRLKQTTVAQLYKARHLYVMRGMPEQIVAEEVGVPVSIIRHWSIHFDWKDRRNKLLFEKFCKIQEIKERSKKGMDDRHDRLATTLEHTIEDMLHEHHNPDSKVRLGTKDISLLARSIRELQGVRKVAHGEVSQQRKTTIELDTSESFDNMSKMLESFFGAKPKVGHEEVKQLPASIPEAIDAEFEVLEDDDGSNEQD